MNFLKSLFVFMLSGTTYASTSTSDEESRTHKQPYKRPQEIFNDRWFGKDRIAIVILANQTRYCATFDLSDQTLLRQYTISDPEDIDFEIIYPALQAIEDQFLMSYKTEADGTIPEKADASFSLRDVDTKKFKRVWFTSNLLDSCLDEMFSTLEKKGKVSTPHGEHPITESLLEKLEGPDKPMILKWTASSWSCLNKHMQRKKDGIFILVRDLGILKGLYSKIYYEFEPKEELDTHWNAPEGSLMSHKILLAWRDMFEKYFAGSRESCLNYQASFDWFWAH